MVSCVFLVNFSRNIKVSALFVKVKVELLYHEGPEQVYKQPSTSSTCIQSLKGQLTETISVFRCCKLVHFHPSFTHAHVHISLIAVARGSPQTNLPLKRLLAESGHEQRGECEQNLHLDQQCEPGRTQHRLLWPNVPGHVPKPPPASRQWGWTRTAGLFLKLDFRYKTKINTIDRFWKNLNCIYFERYRRMIKGSVGLVLSLDSWIINLIS